MATFTMSSDNVDNLMAEALERLGWSVAKCALTLCSLDVLNAWNSARSTGPDRSKLCYKWSSRERQAVCVCFL